MKIQISYSDPLSHLLDIEIRFDQLTSAISHFLLPAWRPGRYELQNYAQNMYRVYAHDAITSKTLEVSKTARNTWAVANGDVTSVVIKYQYFALQMDAGGSWLDEEQVYINFINCILYRTEQLDVPIVIDLQLPSDYRVATGLEKIEGRVYKAADYHELVDSPLIASSGLKELVYDIDQAKFHIWFQGAVDIDENKILQDFKAFTQVQMDMFGGFPTDHYHFLIQLVNYPKYHGVEHHNSTVITLGPDTGFDSEKAYMNLLGISSHELFHVWNIKRIRPQELRPYDYSGENYFDTGYIAEGITTYYGDLMLVRSGALNQDQYFDEINKYLERHFMNPGRHEFSLAESSNDLWIDGYKRSAPKRKVSIYIKGALVAMILDLKLREMTNNRISLDTVMQKMWENYKQNQAGYTTETYQQIIEELTETSWASYFQELIYGLTPLEDRLQASFSYIGCELSIEDHSSFVRNKIGVVLDKSYAALYIDENGPAKRHLSIGDKIQSINEIPIEQFKNKGIKIDTSDLNLVVNRFGRICNIQLKTTDKTCFHSYKIKRISDSSEKSRDNFHEFVNSL